jgi:hypothetical protein
LEKVIAGRGKIYLPARLQVLRPTSDRLRRLRAHSRELGLWQRGLDRPQRQFFGNPAPGEVALRYLVYFLATRLLYGGQEEHKMRKCGVQAGNSGQSEDEFP